MARPSGSVIQAGLVALLVALAMCPVQRVGALQCYACNSLQDDNCWNVSLLNAGQIQGCEDLYYACTTRLTTMEGYSFIGRNCLPKGICENTINVDGEIEDRCVTCDTDFCNTGSGASAGGEVKIVESFVRVSLLVVLFAAVNVNWL